jgi:aspartate aminotransferase
MTRRRLADRMEDMPESITLAAKHIAQVRRSKNLPVYDFGLGEAKGEVDDLIVEAACTAIQEHKTGYVHPGGIPELREAILRWLSVEEHYSIDNVVVSVGAKQAIYNIFLAILNPGDSVLLDAAPWVSYAPMIQACSAVPVSIKPRLGEKNRLKISPKDLEEKLLEYPHAKALLVNSPCNPTGQLYTQEEINELLHICVEHEVFFILDRLYWKTLFEVDEYPQPELSSKTLPWLIQIDGLSKNWCGVGGLRVGWSVASQDISATMTNLQSHITSGTATPGQHAALAVLNQEYNDHMQQSLKKKQALFFELANAIDGIDPLPSQGAFYSFWNVEKLFGKTTPDGTVLQDSEDLTNYLIQEAGVITVPGKAFLLEGYLRTCFHIPEDEIKAGLAATKKAVDALK